MEELNIEEVQIQLPTLVERVVAGESFVITKNGQPLATISAYEDDEDDPRIGFMEGLITIPDDFNTMMADEIAEMFYGPEGIEW